MFENMNTVFGALWLLSSKLEEKMPRFAEFTKRIPLEYTGRESTSDYSKCQLPTTSIGGSS